MFSKETYCERRQKLMQTVGEGVILFLGNSESPRNFLDNIYPFRQDSSFLYFTGLSSPDLALIIDTESGDEILFGDDATIDQIVWMGRQQTIGEMGRSCGLDRAMSLGGLYTYLETIRQKGREVHFLPPYRTDTQLFFSELLEIPPHVLVDGKSDKLIRAIVQQRIYKSDEEISEIEKAVNSSVDMHCTAIQMARPGMKEQELVAAVTKEALSSVGNLSFPVIATINGQTLHNHDYSNTLKEGELLLLDAGAETSMGYAGDLSSTFPVSCAFTQVQKEVYEICLASHEAAIDMLKPGISFKDVYFQAARVIFDGMKSMGLAKGNTEDALLAGAHAMFFPCGLGHMMGLDVHDMESLGEHWVGWNGEQRPDQFGIKSLRLGRILEPGFVLTIEPGIYFIPELIDLWKQQGIHTGFLNYERLEEFKTFGGIRNEEDFLITPDGKRLLGKKKPKTVKEIESLRE